MEREGERQRQSIREWVIRGSGSLERGSVEEQFKTDKVDRICFAAEAMVMQRRSNNDSLIHMP